jgi:hypothetical protein
MDPYEVALRMGDPAGIRLEMVGGIPTWEAFPVARHQIAVDRIRASIQPSAGNGLSCTCRNLADVYVKFPDGSLKRPDISIFCSETIELDEAITVLPEAVIEVISKGYESKDMGIGVPFYLRMGVKDIVVFDPETSAVRHFRPGKPEAIHQSPVTLPLACGCRVTV